MKKKCANGNNVHQWFGMFYLFRIPVVRRCRMCGAKRVL